MRFGDTFAFLFSSADGQMNNVSSADIISLDLIISKENKMIFI
jgi:hypothetical protein